MDLTAAFNRGAEDLAATARFLQILCAPGCTGVDVPVALICAHPDDETIGAGTRMPRLRELTILHVTDGAPAGMEDALRNGYTSREDYSSVRRKELEAAVGLCNVNRSQLHECGFPDQGATHAMTSVTQTVLEFVERASPAVVITHPYEGGHPDHDATAFAVHTASALLHRNSGVRPAIVEMASYHNREGSLDAGGFLENDDCSAVETAWLTPPERELKQKMFNCFRTQSAVLDLFSTDVERFRPAPRYDFTKPPHPGTLYYELHPWGMSGEQFRKYASAALQELGLAEENL